MAENQSFLGRGWSFPPEFDKNATNGVVMVSDVEDINQSLEILLSTQIGERAPQLAYGSDLSEYVFRPMNASLLTELKELITTAILAFEPRIRPNFIELRPDQIEGILYIDLTYTVLSLNTRINLVFPYYLNEATNIEQ